MKGIDLTEDNKIIEDHEHFMIFQRGEQKLAAIYVDENEDPLPGNDPNDYGWLLLQINYLDMSGLPEQPGLAIAEVEHVSTLLSQEDIEFMIEE